MGLDSFDSIETRLITADYAENVLARSAERR
jgi:hypothetical protein